MSVSPHQETFVDAQGGHRTGHDIDLWCGTGPRSAATVPQTRTTVFTGIDIKGAIRTCAPGCGAWMIFPSPTYIPMWLRPA